MTKPGLKLATSPRSNKVTPNIVLALAPSDKNELIELYVSPETIRQFMDDNLNAKIGEYCGLVHGNVDEWTETGGSQEGGTYGLLEAHALFQGIKRPRTGQGKDESILIYVMNHAHTYIYQNNNRFSVTGPTRARRPSHSVFVAYVELLEEPELGMKGGSEAAGRVLFWEWVRSSDDDPLLPVSCETRYTKRHW